MKVKSEREVAQSCPTLSDPMDCSLPGSAIHGILQARVLEWGAIAFSIGDSYSECWALFFSPHSISGFLGLAVVKNMPANAGDAGDLSLIPGSGEDPLEKETATHSSVLAWRIPWIEDFGRIQSVGSQRIGHD